nr:MAG TPA: hypothetical protein [Caudoviricetes sp.]
MDKESQLLKEATLKNNELKYDWVEIKNIQYLIKIFSVPIFLLLFVTIGVISFVKVPGIMINIIWALLIITSLLYAMYAKNVNYSDCKVYKSFIINRFSDRKKLKDLVITFEREYDEKIKNVNLSTAQKTDKFFELLGEYLFSKKIETDYENYEQRANEEIQKISEELVGKRETEEENIEEEILEKPVEEKQEESFVYDFDD